MLPHVLVTALALLGEAAASRPGIWPAPATIDCGDETLWLDRSVKASLWCGNSSAVILQVLPAHSLYHYREMIARQVSQSSTRLQQYLGVSKSIRDNEHCYEQDFLESAVRETFTQIHDATFVPWKFHTRHSSFEPDQKLVQHLRQVVIIQKGCPSNASLYPKAFFGGDESYQIDIKDTTATIQTNSSIGTLRALETFRQLFYTHSQGGSYTPYTPIQIRDAPTWHYRGLSLDIARNPIPPSDVLRTIDAMATTKLNKLHLHSTDSQSWPIEIPSLPDLASRGAYQPGLVWSTCDLSSVQKYGLQRGVEVYLELDMPGHTASIANGYPDLIAAFNQLDWSSFALEPLSGQLKLNSTAVYNFLTTLFTDLLPRLTPYTSHYHLGGDEINTLIHALDPTTNTSSPSILQPLIQSLISNILNHTTTHSLRPILWEELILDWNLTFASLPPDLQPLIQSWRSSSHIASLLEKNHKVIFGDSQHWYLDCGFGSFISPYPANSSPPGVPYNTSGGRASQLHPPYLDYCNPYHNWRDVYTFNPLAEVSQHLWKGIEGGEVLLWSEQTDGVDLDFKLWPRAAAAAEVLWRGPREQGELGDAEWRLGQWRERVLGRGVRSGAVGMTWCLMEGGCEL